MDDWVPGGEERARPAKLEAGPGPGGAEPEPPRPSPTMGGASGDATAPAVVGARGLLDRLRSVEFSLEADRRLLRVFEEAEAHRSPSPERGRGPVRSPEAAEEELHLPSALDDLAGRSLAEVRERLAGNSRRRRRILGEMAEIGCFEGRWVGDGKRAFYLERLAEPGTGGDEADTGGPRFEVRQGPWAWVADAPPGEDPRETLRRGEILSRSWASRREFFVLLAVPFLATVLAHPLLPPAFLLVLLAAVVLPLLLYLRCGRRRLLDVLFAGDDARRRRAEELAAFVQLGQVRRGVGDGPALEELTREIARKLQRKASVPGRGEIPPGTRAGARTTGAPDPRQPAARNGDDAAPGFPVVGTVEVAALLSLAGGEKTLGELLAHLRAFSGTVLAPGPREMADSLHGLERAGLVSETSGEPPFTRYEITPLGTRGLRALNTHAGPGDPETGPATAHVVADAVGAASQGRTAPTRQ